ncbi:MAG TPA: hypothetical protein VHI13_09885 [Candidatus Kapabacteria bacterium]|nr:hypothetical protein [Candidatus Kapabacteria bacterium]
MEAPTFQGSLPFAGSASHVLDLAAMALSANGFRVAERSATSAEFAGPGMRSTNQNPILGASRIMITCSADTIGVAAELGAMARMQRFARVFPPVLLGGIGTVLSVIFLIVFGASHWRVWLLAVLLVVAVQGAIWAVVGPLLARRIESRVRASLDMFLRNIATAATE